MAYRTSVKVMAAIVAIGFIPHAGYVWTRDCDSRNNDGTKRLDVSVACAAFVSAFWPIYVALKTSAWLMSEENLARTVKIKIQVD